MMPAFTPTWGAIARCPVSRSWPRSQSGGGHHGLKALGEVWMPSDPLSHVVMSGELVPLAPPEKPFVVVGPHGNRCRAQEVVQQLAACLNPRLLGVQRGQAVKLEVEVEDHVVELAG